MENTSANTRREFIKKATIVSLGFAALSRCTLSTEQSESLAKVLLKTDPKGYLDLPEGFSYKVIAKSGAKMADGFLVPGRPDGMGSFAGSDGKVILICNHENSPNTLEHSPFGPENELAEQLDPAQFYDAGSGKMPGLGGTSTIIYNEETQTVEKQYLSLAGTYRNCAGGITPWNSWLTCEEDTNVKGEVIEKDHGYVFEVPASVDAQLANPEPIIGMGRFNHEAVAVDPATGIVYQTEDTHDGLIYRYIPNVKGELLKGGKLQALAIKGQKSFDTRNWEGRTINLQEEIQVEWIDMDDVESPKDDLRLRGFDQGAARFARGEGMWYGNGEIYFACTNGGPKKLGQVFRYKPSSEEGTAGELNNPGVVELFAESEDKGILNMCDNLTIAPWGDVILCEDNGERNHIRGINQKGELYDFGRNMSSKSEFTGLTFSPSGKTLFVNIQENGDTVAITGPWDTLA